MVAPRGKISRVPWNSIHDWIRELAAEQDQWDCIIGISRSGVPLAVSLSYYCETKPLEFLYRSQAPGPRAPFYVFDEGRAARLEHARKSFRLTTAGKYRRPLVIDDVTTFGDTLTVAGELLAAEGITDIIFATYAVDLTVLERERPELARRVKYAATIDNSSVWLSFPWQRDEVQ
jgi:hypoxanthine phosphoribosyltransferase